MPRRIWPSGILLAALLACAAAYAAPAQQPATPKPPALDVTGQWAMTIVMDVGTGTPALQLKQDGDKLTGTYSGNYGDFAVTGTLQGQDIQFAFTMGADQPMTMSFAGKVAADGQSMKGTADMADMGSATWEAKRQKDGWWVP